MGFKLKSGNKPKMSGGLLAQCEPMDNLTIAVVETTPMNKGFRSNEQAHRLLEKGKFDKYQKKLSQDLGGGMEGAASPLKEDDDDEKEETTPAEERNEEVGGTTPPEPVEDEIPAEVPAEDEEDEQLEIERKYYQKPDVSAEPLQGADFLQAFIQGMG